MGKADPDRIHILQDWEEAFGSPPPPYLSVAFMRKALCHEAQCRRHGGLPPDIRRALRQIARGHSVSDSTRRVARPGSRLVREWNGRTYHVEVLKEGYCMDTRTWPSLSAIAKHITGTTWSGPRFFGLVDRTRDTS
ncbi:DUF2924 domain-containing protein [Silicimonas algicola]|uniref:DUF2924 family protein n=1 Tax=Silicimonas algicola TaxID=1826607 RepID=A0A316G934_9RHOB|nr:DUF2924 domain-containing protein [Silicimonas algicola]AZQ68701.1 DUF2924 domain-containing protein [Silicimonas algicola]PWK56230.1 hypothetical protein C8D95_105298 [Silicimonas algicola]